MNVIKAVTGLALVLLLVALCPTADAARKGRHRAVSRNYRYRARDYNAFERRAMKVARGMPGLGYFRCIKQYVCGAYLDKVGPLFQRHKKDKMKDDLLDCFLGGKDQTQDECSKSCGADASGSDMDRALCDQPDCKNSKNFKHYYCQVDCTVSMNDAEEACKAVDCTTKNANDDFRCKTQNERDSIQLRRRQRQMRKTVRMARRFEKMSLAKNFNMKRAKWMLKRAENDPHLNPDAPDDTVAPNPPPTSGGGTPNVPTPYDPNDQDNYDGECTGNIIHKICRILESPFQCIYRCLFKHCTPYHLPDDVVAEIMKEKGITHTGADIAHCYAGGKDENQVNCANLDCSGKDSSLPECFPRTPRMARRLRRRAKKQRRGFEIVCMIYKGFYGP